MGQIISTLLNVMVLLLVPLGVLQVHTAAQVRSELLEISAAAVKYLSNHGGTSDSEVLSDIRQFVRQELVSKSFHIPESELQISVVRTKAVDPLLWSHEDEFQLRMQIPFPLFTEMFPIEKSTISVVRKGTVNIMDYDL
jgi:hypothetical protein